MALAIASCFCFGLARGNPVGPQLVSGAATFSSSGNTLTITNLPGTIINWQGFSIGSKEITRFIQASSASTVLNRVVSNNPSQLLGSLQSNGRVFLINPAGILVGAGAVVDTAGFVASTLNLSDSDFLAGRLNFTSTPGAGRVENYGSISTPSGGSVYLVGAKVENHGIIKTPQGEVLLAAGKTVRLIDTGTPGVQVEITAENEQALNLGQLLADSGRVGMVGAIVRNSGRISASSVTSDGGRVFLRATQDSYVEQGGSIEATGSKGGRIEVLGNRVALTDQASLDASGTGGGGTILVGGDYQGKNPEVANASRTQVSAGASLRADATETGDGGKVVVWANGDTRMLGSVSARGGALAGDGGLVEVSGKELLDMRGRIDVAAPSGAGGKVLLDPQSIVLNTTTQASPPNNANGTADVAFADAPAAGTYTIQIADVTGYSELFLQATRDITVSSAVAMNAGNSIRFEANNNININGALTVLGAGNIKLKADADASGAGTLAIAAAVRSQIGGVSLAGARVTSTAAGTVSASGAANADAGSIGISATADVSLAGNLSASGGTASAGTPGRNGGAINITAAGIALGAATLTASGSNGSGATQAGGAGGTITLTSTNGVSGSGAVTASGGNGGTGIANGGNAGSISVANSGAGNVSVGALTARSGNAVTTGTGGAAGSVNATNIVAAGSLATGAINTSGGNNGAAGSVTLSSAGTLAAGAIAASGGTALAGTSGRNAGNVTLNSGGTITALGIITASGSAGVLTGDQAGGNGGAVSITAVGGIAGAAITASGGAAAGTNAAGGNAGSIVIANSASGNLVTGNLAAQSGAALGTGAGGTAGAITVANTAGNLTTGSVTTSGGAKGHGGSVSLSALGALSTGAAGTIDTSGGVTITGNAGRNAGSVTLAGNSVSTGTGAITARGSAGLGSNQAGGSAGAVSITSAGAVTSGVITSSSGNATGTGGGGGAGAITLTGGNLSLANLVATGGTNGNGGAVTVTAAGSLALGSIAAGGGAGATSGGTVTLTGSGAVTQTGSIVAASLALEGAGGSYALRNAGNAVTTLAAQTGSIDFAQAGALTVGTVGIAGVTATGFARIETTAAASSLTLASPVIAAGTGDAIILKAGSSNAAGVSGGGQIINSVGAGGIVATTGRYLAYSGDPSSTTEGVTAYGKRYNSAASYVPGGTSSMFLYRIAPTLTVTANNKTRVYGDANPIFDGSVAGLIDGDSAATVGPTFTSTADTHTAVAAGPAVISAGAINNANYTLILNNGALTITARPLTVSATGSNRVYDGTIAAPVTLSDNRVAGDTLTLSDTSATFANKNVGTGKSINVSGISVGGAAAANYTWNTTAATSADITARPLTISAAGQNKVYDGTIGAVITPTDDRIAGDVLTVTGAASFADKNAGIAKTINITGINVTGADSGNYSFAPTATASADITARPLSVAATGTNKVYDGNVSAAVTLSDNRLAGDVLTVSSVSASFADKSVATGKTVSVAGISIAGADSANYSANTTAATVADITARALTVSATGTNKVYDGNVNATVTLADNRVAGDVLTVSSTSASFADKNVGTAKPISVTGINLAGADSGNYTANTTTATAADITARPLTVSATGTNKVYDGNVSAAVTLSDNRVAGDMLTVTSALASFVDKNVGTAKTINIGGINVTGTDSGNYSFAPNATAAADISAWALNVTATGTNKVYDGSANATVTFADNRVAGDVLTVSSASASFADKNVGTAKPISVAGINLAGTDSANYSANTAAATAADITARPLTVSATGTNKVYDGNVNATVTLHDNRVAGDVLTVSSTSASFADKNVGTAKPISVTGINVTGTDSGNYSANTTAATSADITAGALPVVLVSNLLPGSSFFESWVDALPATPECLNSFNAAGQRIQAGRVQKRGPWQAGWLQLNPAGC
jgi:filamentous hemagglutinin family protein